MQGRRVFMSGLLPLAAAGLLPARRAAAQFYPPRPYGNDDEEEHRRYEERRRDEERRRHDYYEQHGQGGDRTFALEQRRNERVLALQQQLARHQIDRRQFDYGVAEIDRELNAQLFGQ